MGKEGARELDVEGAFARDRRVELGVAHVRGGVLGEHPREFYVSGRRTSLACAQALPERYAAQLAQQDLDRHVSVGREPHPAEGLRLLRREHRAPLAQQREERERVGDRALDCSVKLFRGVGRPIARHAARLLQPLQLQPELRPRQPALGEREGSRRGCLDRKRFGQLLGGRAAALQVGEAHAGLRKLRPKRRQLGQSARQPQAAESELLLLGKWRSHPLRRGARRRLGHCRCATWLRCIPAGRLADR
eukprot:6188798-Pleurochrysis_carterae.AAC.3